MSRIVLLVLALAACGKPSITPRERVLAVLPAEASAVFVADGPSLANAKFKPIIDALRPRWPGAMGCVIDAGLAADEVGVAATKSGTSIAILTQRAPDKCAALSQRSPNIWIATIGAGLFADAKTPSVKDDPRFARARAHLLAAPIGATLESARFKTHVHASAQPEPLEAWVAFDADPDFAPTLEAGIRAVAEKMTNDSTTSGVAARMHVTRDGAQIVVKVDGKVDADLGAAARTLVQWGWGQTSVAPPAPGWTCPTEKTDLVVGCTSRTMSVSSLAKLGVALREAPIVPVVTNGAVSGLRVDKALPAFGLLKGDLIYACEGRPLANLDQLVDQVINGPHGASITVRRDEVDTKLEFLAK